MICEHDMIKLKLLQLMLKEEKQHFEMCAFTVFSLCCFILHCSNLSEKLLNL